MKTRMKGRKKIAGEEEGSARSQGQDEKASGKEDRRER